MSDECNNLLIPQHCAERFEDISTALGKLSSVPDDLKELRKAVIGNGKVERSVVFRLRQLEQHSSAGQTAGRKWRERIWKVFVAAALVVFGVWLKSD